MTAEKPPRSSSTSEDREKELRSKLDRLEDEGQRSSEGPYRGASRERGGLENEVAEAEAELRGLENTKHTEGRKKEIRDRLASLENEAQRSSDSKYRGASRERSGLEGEVLELEDELRTLEGGKPRADKTAAELREELKAGVEELSAISGETPEKAETPKEDEKAPEAAVAPQPEATKSSIEDQQARIRALALGNRGPEAMDRMEKELGTGLRTSKEFYKHSAPLAEKMLTSEKAFLDALRAHQKSRNTMGVIGENIVGQRKHPPEVQALRDAWVKDRADYARYLNASAEVRHHDRGIDNPNRKKLDRDEVLARYQRRFTAREVVLGAEEAEVRARKEGLDSREKGWLGKAFDGYKSKAQWVRVLTSSALLTGSIIAVAGGATIGLPLVLGAASVLTAAAALRAKSGSKSEAFFAGASIAGVFGLVGDKAVRGAHWLFGTQKKADAKIAQRAGLGNLGDVSNLGAVSVGRRHALNTQSRIDLQARYARLGAAIVGGMEAGHMLADHGPQLGGHENAAVSGVAPTPEVKDVTLAVGGDINNADQLVGHFGRDLLQEYPDADTAPPAVQTLYRLLGEKDGNINLMTGEDSATLALGFQDEGQFSTIMHDGDSIRLHDGEVQFQKVGESEWRTLIDEEGVYGRVVDDLDKMNLQGEIRDGSPVESEPVVNEESVPAQPTETVRAEAEVGSGTEEPRAEVRAETPAEEPRAETPPAESTPTGDSSTPEQPNVRTVEEENEITRSANLAQAESAAQANAALAHEQALREAANSAPAASAVEVSASAPNPVEAHVYGVPNENFYQAYGGTFEELQKTAQDLAIDSGRTVFIDASYQDPLGGTVLRSLGFEPDGTGGVRMVVTEDPRFAVRPDNFTSVIR